MAGFEIRVGLENRARHYLELRSIRDPVGSRACASAPIPLTRSWRLLGVIVGARARLVAMIETARLRPKAR